MSQEERIQQLEEGIRLLEEAVRYALDKHHLHGPECLCQAARSTLESGLALALPATQREEE